MKVLNRVLAGVGTLAALLAAPVRAEIIDMDDSLLIVNATLEEYESYVDLFFGNHDIRYFEASTTTVSGFRISAIFDKQPGGFDVSHFYNLSEASMQTHIDALKAENYEMIQLNSYSYFGETRYAYIAYHRDGPEWEAVLSAPQDAIQIFDDGLPSSINVVNVSATGDGLTVLYKADGTYTSAEYEWLSYSEVVSLTQTMRNQGYWLTDMEIVSDSAGMLAKQYMPVYKKSGSLHFAGLHVLDSHSTDVSNWIQASSLKLRPMFVKHYDNASQLPQPGLSGWTEYFVGFVSPPIVNSGIPADNDQLLSPDTMDPWRNSIRAFKGEQLFQKSRSR